MNRDKGDASISTPQGPDASTSDQDPGLDRAIQSKIGDKLRAMYGELIDQPVPDRLLAILGQLDGDQEHSQ